MEKVGLVVELGSGQSTFQLAQDFPNSSVYSLENDKKYLEKSNNELLVYGFKNAKIILATIKTISWQGAIYSTYDMSYLKKIQSIDFLIIDGPVERLYPGGREAALYLLFDMCAIGAVIGLDDYHRKTAKRAVSNWLETYGEAIILEQETSSFAVLRKVSECNLPKMSWPRRAQSIKATTYSFSKRGLRKLAGILRALRSK